MYSGNISTSKQRFSVVKISIDIYLIKPVASYAIVIVWFHTQITDEIAKLKKKKRNSRWEIAWILNA